MKACPICSLPCPTYSCPANHIEVECVHCGRFLLTTEAECLLDQRHFSAEQVANIGGYIRENEGLLITSRDLEYLSGLRTPGVGEKAAKLLLALAREFPRAGAEFFVNYYSIDMVLTQLQSARLAGGYHDQSITADVSKLIRWLAVAWCTFGRRVRVSDG